MEDNKIEKPVDQNFIDVDQTAMPEYLEVIKNEYEIERAKKNSFENRSGIILAFLGVLSVFIFEKIPINTIISMMNSNLTFLLLVRIIAGILSYLGFFFALGAIIRTIAVQKQSNFEVKNIDEDLLTEVKIVSLCKLIFTYRDIIVQHRSLNEKRASAFRLCLYSVVGTIVFTIVFISMS